MDGDLNATVGPAWLDHAATEARRILLASDLPPVVGHGDWYGGNLWWSGRRLVAVHDWDSVISQPEAAVCGAAAAVFTATGPPWTPASVSETNEFISAYVRARGEQFTEDELRVAWAAGLWVRCFDAKKEAAGGDPVGNIAEAEAALRLRRAIAP
jgi:hypothetical protein